MTVQNADSLWKFKEELKNHDVWNENQFQHHLFGPRKFNTIFTKVTCSASFLNCDLFRVNM